MLFLKALSMNVDLVRDALLLSTLVNSALLILWFLFFTVGRDWTSRFHGIWFRFSVERFDAIHYAGMTFYTIVIVFFNVAPLVALSVVV
jgi:hypothetical protein